MTPVESDESGYNPRNRMVPLQASTLVVSPVTFYWGLTVTTFSSDWA